MEARKTCTTCRFKNESRANHPCNSCTNYGSYVPDTEAYIQSIQAKEWPFSETAKATEANGIGDVNSTAKGSGARYNAGKADFSLIPLSTLEDEAKVWGYGTKKYAAWNWAKGMPWSVPFACLMRHMAAWQRGEENDPESGLPHLAHAMCNLRMLTLYSKTYLEGDDRPKEHL